MKKKRLMQQKLWGDDRLQKRSQGYVVPDSFTHGTSAQRLEWFRKAYKAPTLLCVILLTNKIFKADSLQPFYFCSIQHKKCGQFQPALFFMILSLRELTYFAVTRYVFHTTWSKVSDVQDSRRFCQNNASNVDIFHR